MNKTVVGSLLAIVLLAVGVVFAASSALGPKDGPAQQSAAPSAAAEGEAASASVSDRPDCPAGPVAGVDLPCLGGETTGTAQGIEIVNVWAWWCEPCRTEMPLLATVAARHPEWTLVGVHADPAASNGAAFLGDIGVDMPSYQDSDNTFAGSLGLPGVIPITLVVKDGQIVGRIIKAMTTEDEIEQAIEEYL